MSEQIPSSPEGLQLRTTPLASARLSKKAVLSAIGILALILGVVIINISRGKPVKAAEASTLAKELQPSVNVGKELSKDIPDVIIAPPQPLPEAAPHSEASTKSLLNDARLADTAVVKFSDVQRTEMRAAVAAASEEAPAEDADPGEAADSAATRGANPGGHIGAGLLRVANSSLEGGMDLNRQDEKAAFSSKQQHSAYLAATFKAPISPYEIKTGTVIPSLLISEINSDLPGEIIAQVSQNVYDSATGKYLLIPQGAKLFGRYDSKVSYGQKRALVSWDRLIYPNAYTLDLDGMRGHDMSGQSGFKDQINNHYAKIFGLALFTSALSAGYQLSQPQQSNSLVPSSGQVAAAAVGQQMAQLGENIATRNMQVQPTIVIRKGYHLNVMVNRDILFPGTYPPEDN
jgi:type IV secretion system protein VirB10